MFKKAGRPDLLDSNSIKKVKDIGTGTRGAGVVTNRRQILNIEKGAVKANNPSFERVWWNAQVDRSMGERFTRKIKVNK